MSGGGTLGASGRCLCGAVRYRVTGPMRPVVGCHCEMCRRTSGHYVAASAARREDLRIVEDRGLRWYRSSERARRGFCGECGGNLFYDHGERPYVAIMAGTLDSPTGLSTALHICVETKGDYYGLPAGEPVQNGLQHDVFIPDTGDR